LSFPLGTRLAAEALGTAALVAAIVGSGIMADRLTDDAAVALLCNALATGAVLVVLIATLGPISGAQLNPAVSLAAALTRTLPVLEAALYALAQIAGGVIGTIVAHAMFAEPLLQVSAQVRDGLSLAFAEALAAFGLVSVVFIAARFRAEALPWLVGLYITSAYWFTSSTSFANPAVTIARSLTDTFAGIRPVDVPGFILAQLLGAIAAVVVIRLLLKPAALRR
jgi:glycerol uptake facilitator-like aquaporin